MIALADHSQLEWLEHDRKEMRRLLAEDATLFEPLADTTDPRAHTLYLVIADLFWQVWYHAIAVEVLLREELTTTVVVVQRALYEAIATLAYLHSHPNRSSEAEVLLASTYVRQLALFGEQKQVREEREEILARMPPDSVNTARQRLSKGRRTWTGKSIREMMTAANVTGYDTLYSYLSSKTHAGIAGEHVRILRGTGSMATIHIGSTISTNDVEAHANFARRALHGSLQILWEHFGRGRPLTIHSANPFEWAMPRPS